MATTAQRLPKVGGYYIVLTHDGTPAGIIRTTEVEIKPYTEADDSFVRDQGEGDGTLEWWRRAHHPEFARACRAHGVEFDDGTPVLFERFELVWPRAETE